MSAEVATYPTVSPSTPTDFKHEEPMIYVSTAKLELKLSAAMQSASEFVWHTQVVPKAAVETKEEKEAVSEALVQESVAAQPAEAVNRSIYKSAQQYGKKPGSLAATLYDFMDVERYNSERNQLASKGQSCPNEKETTYI